MNFTTHKIQPVFPILKITFAHWHILFNSYTYISGKNIYSYILFKNIHTFSCYSIDIYDYDSKKCPNCFGKKRHYAKS